MNILYINHYAGSPSYGMEYRPYYLAKNWVEQGHKVTILAGDYSHLRQKNPVIKTKQSYQVEHLEGIDYIWCKTSTYAHNGIKRVFNIFSFLYRAFKFAPHFINKFKPDLVIASSTYPFDTILANYIAKRSGAKFIYEVHDLWPLTLIELSNMSKYHPFIWLMQRAENFGYRNCDKVVSLLPLAKSYMQEHGLKEDKFIYIPNGVDLTIEDRQIIPAHHLAKIKQIKSKYKFLLGYAGGMGESNALEYLISASKEVASSGIAVILVGMGPTRDLLIKRLADEGIDNVYFLPSIKKAQVADFLSYMDGLYIGWNNLPIYRFGICPNKLFDYMLAKKPILHSVGVGNDLVLDAKCGVSVMAEDISAIRDGMIKLSQLSKDERDEMGQNGYDYVIKNHDYAKLARQFLDLAKL